MKYFVFPYSISFGKLDTVSGDIRHGLSDDKAERLIRSAEEGRRHELDEDAFISDIFADIQDALERKLIAALRRDPTPVRDALSWYPGYHPEKPIGTKEIQKYLDDLMITIYYPRKLQLLEPQVKAEPQIAEYVVMDEAQAIKAVKQDHYGNNVIILTDEGRTLYNIPQKFVGSVVIPASVRTIRAGFSSGAFYKRTMITEIIIEDGLTEIPECAFSSCEQLTRVMIPASVIKIGFNAFSGCSSLTEVCFSEGLQELDSSAFRFCSKLTTIGLPSTLIEINKHITSYWAPIRDIYFYGMKTTINDRMGGDWSRVTMHVLPGSEAEKYAVEHNVKYVIIHE